MPVLTEPETVEELKRELARLRADFDRRVAELEKKLAVSTPTAVRSPAPQPSPVPVKPEVSPETVAMIAAAVTAFLGKKVKIRHAHRIDSGTTPWAQQGRAIIQASHNLVR